MAKYKVVLYVEVSDEKKTEIHTDGEIDDIAFIETELGWAKESFSGFDIDSIKKVRCRKNG